MSSLSSAITSPIRLRVQLIYPKIALFQIGLFAAMIYRGLDYVTPPSEELKTLSVIEQALSVHFWGALLIAGGLTGLVGLRWLRWPLAAVAHVVGLAVYSAFTVGFILSIAERAHPPTVYAWTVVGCLAAASAVTFVVLYRYAPRQKFYAWVFLAAAFTASLVTLATSAEVFGWRTATGWAFVQCIAHTVMADASWDAWRDYRQERTDESPQ